MRKTHLMVLGIAVVIVSTQCSMPGTTLGIYSVQGTLTSNTCGNGLQAPNPWTFNVELSKTSTNLYWNMMDGTALLTGTMSGLTMNTSATTTANVDGTDASTGPCTMTRSDALEVTLASGAIPSSFTGTLSYAFAATSGSTCTDQLTSNGGLYDALPCTIAYDLSASIK